jgi:hypothetical protein
MSFTPNMPDSAGTFAPDKTVATPCRHCGKVGEVVEKAWDSSCGGWTDYRYDCRACGKGWWEEGIDS